MSPLCPDRALDLDCHSRLVPPVEPPFPCGMEAVFGRELRAIQNLPYKFELAQFRISQIEGLRDLRSACLVSSVTFSKRSSSSATIK